MDTFLTISNTPEAIYKDKGSKFLAFAFHVVSTDEVKVIIADMRKRFFDARHVCYAYMIGYERKCFRANDDGEPSGTAGKPILGQINSAQLTDILIVVVRYFGGTLLGTSGLIQAYKTSAADVISAAEIEERIIEKQFVVQFGYDMQAPVMRIIKDFNLTVVALHQEMSCEAVISIRLDNIPAVTARFGQLYSVVFKECETESEQLEEE